MTSFYNKEPNPCNQQQPRLCAKQAAQDLASLMENKMGMSRVDPVALRLFIRAYWSRVSLLAHAIHDED